MPRPGEKEKEIEDVIKNQGKPTCKMHGPPYTRG